MTIGIGTNSGIDILVRAETDLTRGIIVMFSSTTDSAADDGGVTLDGDYGNQPQSMMHVEQCSLNNQVLPLGITNSNINANTTGSIRVWGPVWAQYSATQEVLVRVAGHVGGIAGQLGDAATDTVHWTRCLETKSAVAGDNLVYVFANFMMARLTAGVGGTLVTGGNVLNAT